MSGSHIGIRKPHSGINFYSLKMRRNSFHFSSPVMMRVVVRKAEENVGRLCTITGWNTFGTQGSEQHSNSHPLLETPMCLLYTIAGHLPHVTHDAAAIAGIIPENAVYELTLPTL